MSGNSAFPRWRPQLGRWELLVQILLFVAASNILFVRVVNAFFLSDDFGMIARVVDNPMAFTWGETHGGFLRPVVVLSFWLDHMIWGLNSLGYHVTNATLHGLCAFMACVLSWELLGRFVADAQHRRRLSTLTGVVFLVLPCHSESVAWISGRTDLLATALGLVSTLSFLAYLRVPRITRAALCWTLFALALIAKESVLSLPLLFGLLAMISPTPSRTLRNCAIVLGGCVAVWVAYFSIRYAMLDTFIGGYGAHGHLAIDLPGIADRFVRHTWRAIAPPLGIDVGPYVQSHWKWILLGMAAGGGAACLVGILHRPARRYLLALGLGITCFVILLIPVFTLQVSTVDTQGERFLYFPSLFAAWVLVVVVAGLQSRARMRLALVVAYTVVSALFLLTQIETWRSAGALSGRIAKQAAEHATASETKVVLLNVPADLRGAYVFQNGLPEAVSLLARSLAKHSLEVASAHSVQSEGEPVEVRWNPADGMVEVTLNDPKSRFVRLFDGAAQSPAHVHDDGYSFRLEHEEGTLLCYSDGKVLDWIP